MPATAIKSKPTNAILTAIDYEKQDLLDRLGDLSGFEIMDKLILVAIYMRPEKTPGGLYLPPSNLKEDRYQGKAGLVLKIGAGCVFSTPIAVHDWVVTRPSDTWALDINIKPDTLNIPDLIPCRMLYPDEIRARVADPRMVW